MMNYEEQIRLFYEEGFFLVKKLFSAEAVNEALLSFEKLHEKALILKESQVHNNSYFVLEHASDKTVIKRIVWAGGSEAKLLELSHDKNLLRIVGNLLNTKRVQQLLNQAHFKMPGDGVQFPWHQDIQHREKKAGDWTDIDGRGSYVQTLLALDPIRSDNGPMLFIPKSVKLGRIFHEHTDYDDFEPKPELDTKNAVELHMEPGDVAFFGPYTIHSSKANYSTSPRRVLINGYAQIGANARVYPGCGLGLELEIP